MVILGAKYTFLIASDIERNGLALECYCDVSGEENFVLEVFRDDNKRCFIVNQYVSDLPLDIYEYIVSIAKDKLGAFQP